MAAHRSAIRPHCTLVPQQHERSDEGFVWELIGLGKLGKKAECPESGETDNRKDNAADDRTLSAKQNADNIQTKNADAAPINCADNDKGKDELIHRK
jgi:hypothetical protein